MLFFKLALAVLVMAATASAEAPVIRKAVAIIYGEINSVNYGGGYGGSYGAPAPAPAYGGSYGAPAPAPAYGGSYSSKPYGSSYGAPAPSYGGSYSSKPYGSSYGAPAPSYGGSYPSASASYSSGGYSRPLSYSKPGYNSYQQPSYGAPTYGSSYGAAPAYGGKQTITGKVEFSLNADGTVKAKYNLKVSPSSKPAGYGGYGGYDSGYSKSRSIVINKYGVEKDLRGDAYGSGYSSSYAPPSPYSYSGYSKSIEETCSDTGITIFTVETDADEDYYGKISGNNVVGGSCSSLADIVGRSVVIYKKDGDTSESSGAEPIACGTIALTSEDMPLPT